MPGDWRDPDGWLERALSDCQSRDWTLLVLHDMPNGAMAHLEEFITRMKAAARSSHRNFLRIACRSWMAKSFYRSIPTCLCKKRLNFRSLTVAAHIAASREREGAVSGFFTQTRKEGFFGVFSHTLLSERLKTTG